jgi:hypothetical protein
VLPNMVAPLLNPSVRRRRVAFIEVSGAPMSGINIAEIAGRLFWTLLTFGQIVMKSTDGRRSPLEPIDKPIDLSV